MLSLSDCHVFGVAPEHQGRGAGGLLVQWAVDISEKIGLPFYLESSPTTVKLYEKMGFQRLKETVVHKAETLGTEKDTVVPLMVNMPSYAGMTFEEWVEKGYPELRKPNNGTKG